MNKFLSNAERRLEACKSKEGRNNGLESFCSVIEELIKSIKSMEAAVGARIREMEARISKLEDDEAP